MTFGQANASGDLKARCTDVARRKFADYDWPDYILSEPSKAAFDAALDAIEATQTLYTTPPAWCSGSWCERVMYGGGGRILFGFSDQTIPLSPDRSYLFQPM